MLIFCVFNLILGIFLGILAFSCLFSEAGAGAHIRADLRSPETLCDEWMDNFMCVDGYLD